VPETTLNSVQLGKGGRHDCAPVRSEINVISRNAIWRLHFPGIEQHLIDLLLRKLKGSKEFCLIRKKGRLRAEVKPIRWIALTLRSWRGAAKLPQFGTILKREKTA
jgi:hypothetical protein